MPEVECQTLSQEVISSLLTRSPANSLEQAAIVLCAQANLAP